MCLDLLPLSLLPPVLPLPSFSPLPPLPLPSSPLFPLLSLLLLPLLLSPHSSTLPPPSPSTSFLSPPPSLLSPTAVRKVREAKHRAISMLKSDHFLADANWELVDKTTEIENPYRKIMESVHVSLLYIILHFTSKITILMS